MNAQINLRLPLHHTHIYMTGSVCAGFPNMQESGVLVDPLFPFDSSLSPPGSKGFLFSDPGGVLSCPGEKNGSLKLP